MASAKSCCAPARSFVTLLCGVGNTTVVVTGDVDVVEPALDLVEVDVGGTVVVVVLEEVWPFGGGVVVPGGAVVLEQ